MNIDELNEHGESVATWCFRPERDLPIADVMLAQSPGLKAEPLSALEAQAQAAVSRLHETCPEFVFDVAESLHPSGPLFTESPDKRKLLEQQFRFDDLATEN